MNNPFTTSISYAEDVQLSPKTLYRLRELRAFARANRQRFDSLSLRQREVLTLICKGYTNEEIASQLYRSVNTIRTHRNNIWRTLGIRSVVEAVRWGQAFDLV